jgi:molecular chaperone Hsp33
MNKVKDSLLKIGFKNIPVRLILVKLTDVWQEVKLHNSDSKVAHNILGEALAASGLLMSNIKIDGSVSLQIRSSNHDLSMLVAECNHKFGIRGIARVKDNVESLDMKSLNSLASDDSHFIVNILPNQKHLNPYQGIIPIYIGDNGFSMQDAISNYMHNSEQIDTNVWLCANDDVAVGMLLQRIPHEGGNALHSQDAEDDWLTIKHLASTIKQKELLELDLLTIVQLLFNEYIEQEKVLILDEKTPYFYCTCSQEKAENAIKMELASVESVNELMRDKDFITVDCDFCAKKYGFNYSDCDRIYHSLNESKKYNLK